MELLVVRPLFAGVRGAMEKLAVVHQLARDAWLTVARFPRRAENLDALTENQDAFVDLERGQIEPSPRDDSTDGADNSSHESSDSAPLTPACSSDAGSDDRLEEDDDTVKNDQADGVESDEDEDEEEVDEEEDDDFRRFAGLLDALNRDHIPDYALSVRKRLDPKFEGKAPKMWDPVCGSYNLCFSLDFDDGVEWMIKFPMTGTKEKWTDLSARALTSEAKTMKFIKKETTIPLPEVFDYCASTENELNCPYIIMSFINGTPLNDLWWGHKLGQHTKEQNEQYRLRALKGVAAAMKQLGQFSFSKGGFLEFDDEGKPCDVGPMRLFDHYDVIHRIKTGDYDNRDPWFVEAGPFDEPEDQYKATLFLHEDTPEYEGEKKLLSELISCITENSGDMFDLAHPDFAVQNVIVSEEGELRGIIDWDGVAAVPMSIGSRAYPMWLRRDWDFHWYEYNEDEEARHACWEDSPAQLKEYRRLYARYLAEAHPDLKTPLPADISLMATQDSIVTTALAHAAKDPHDRTAIVAKVMEKIEEAAPPGVYVYYFETTDKLVDGTFSDKDWNDLKDAYQELLEDDL